LTKLTSHKHATRLAGSENWKSAPRASEGNGPSRSHADFFWCKMAQRGWSVEESARKLLEASEKARERARCHDEGYALVTAQNAAAAAAKGPG
jgi:hypothetical protein